MLRGDREVGVIAMRRLGVIVALGALLGMFGGVMTASPALAGRGPKWQFQPSGPFTLPAEFCGFKVRVAFPVNKAYAKVLKASDGSMTFLSTGALKLSYTNMRTGKTVTGNASGPSKTTVFPDGSAVVAGKGHAGLFLPPDLAQRFGLPTVSVTAGPLTISFDPDGHLTSLSLHGHVLADVCAALS
jgi:streptogramin lyase